MIKLFKQLKPFSFMIAFVLALVFVQTLTELYLPTLMSDIVNNGVFKGDTAYIWRTGGIMLIYAGIGMVCVIMVSLLSAKISMGFGNLLRNKVFTKVEGFSLHEFDKFGTATLITRNTNDINQVQQVLVMMMRMMVAAPMMAIGGIIMALSKDVPLSAIIVIVVPLLGVIIFLAARTAIPLFQSMQKKIDKLNLVLRERLTGIRVIRAFNRDSSEKVRFEAANKDLTDTAIKVNKLMALLMPLMFLVMNVTTIAITWFGSIRISNGDMQVGDLMAFTQYVMQIMFSFIMVSMMFIMIPRAQASAVRINEVLEIEPEIKDASNAKDIRTTELTKKGYVEFKDVVFSYPGAEQPAIQGISFIAKPGETTAIIGGTGSGKSTLVNLIPRFYDTDSGEVLIDGENVRDITQDSLRSKIGFVPQKAILFSGTINDNIKYGKDDATDEEVIHAARVAQAEEFITNMKDGYNSVISQGGTNVSGGQKQRLSIARAIVRRPEIYIFDDTFSALDFKTDAKLRAALKNETQDSTVIIVAQRVNTVMDADNIIVLDEGKIAGMGRHKELMKSCSIYREIVASQLSEEEIA